LGVYKDEEDEEIADNMFTESYSDLSENERYRLPKHKKIAHLGAKDDRNSSGDVFNPDNKKNLPNIDGLGKSTQLKNKIESFRKTLISVLEVAEDSSWIINGSADLLKREINNTLEIMEGNSYGEKNKKVSWEHYNFYDMPSVGALTLLSKWQADVKNMEAEVISFLATNIDAQSLKFTSAEATTIPSSNFVLKGEEFKSTIFLTAFDKNANPEIWIGDYDSLGDGKFEYGENGYILSKDEIVDGKGVFTVKGGSVGPKTYKGLIKILQDDGDQYYPFRGKYIVANKSFTVSATQMNVLYANDISNPISVSVAGYQPQDIKVSFSGGKLITVNRKKGEYIVKPSQSKVGKEVTISVSVKKKNGKSQSIGKSEFRVKSVPGQTIFARYSDGKFGKSQISANTFSSKIPKFDFPIKFYVSEFTVVCIGSKRVEKKVRGYKLSESAKQEISKLEKGQTVLFKDFVVKQKGVPTYIDRPKDKYELIIE